VAPLILSWFGSVDASNITSGFGTITITGSFKELGAMPNFTRLTLRGRGCVGLQALFPPVAVVPTIQFGVGDAHRCEALAHRGN
jgi:hypothetical protein